MNREQNKFKKRKKEGTVKKEREAEDLVDDAMLCKMRVQNYITKFASKMTDFLIA